jgi:hypothetical protein
MFVVIVGFELKASGFETLTRRSQLIAHSFLYLASLLPFLR